MVIQHYSAATKYSSKQSLKRFIDFLNNKSITELTHLDVRRFMLRLSEHGVSLICARNHLVSFRRFYDFLNLGGLVNYVAPRLVAIRQTVGRRRATGKRGPRQISPNGQSRSTSHVSSCFCAEISKHVIPRCRAGQYLETATIVITGGSYVHSTG